MLAAYNDILDLTDKTPIWWDECGVPRFVSFLPELVNDIYANEAALVLISCQNCNAKFKVAFSCNAFANIQHKKASPIIVLPIKTFIENKTLHYGDPPRHHNEGYCIGTTMNCNDIKVLEYWHKFDLEWERDKSLEIELEERPEVEK